MRLTLVLVTSAMLTSPVLAQSIAPELRSGGLGSVAAPSVTLTPELAAPTPIASASVDRAELGPEPIGAPIEPTLAIVPAPAIQAPRTSAGPAAGDDRLQPPRRPRVATDRAEQRRDVQSAPRYRPVATGSRDFGRFWPPVF